VGEDSLVFQEADQFAQTRKVFCCTRLQPRAGLRIWGRGRGNDVGAWEVRLQPGLRIAKPRTVGGIESPATIERMKGRQDGSFAIRTLVACGNKKPDIHRRMSAS